jgi:anti-sigma factor RsiW
VCADSKAVAESLAASPAQAKFEAEARKVRALLSAAFSKDNDVDEGDPVRVTLRDNDDQMTACVFHRLGPSETRLARALY